MTKILMLTAEVAASMDINTVLLMLLLLPVAVAAAAPVVSVAMHTL